MNLRKFGMALVGTIALGAVATAAVTGQAQQTKPSEPGKRSHMKRHCGGGRHMMKSLNLTDQQKTLIKPIFEAAKQKMKELRSNTSLTKEAKRAQAKAIMEAARNDMLQYLDAGQKAKLQEMKSKREQRRGSRTTGTRQP